MTLPRKPIIQIAKCKRHEAASLHANLRINHDFIQNVCVPSDEMVLHATPNDLHSHHE